MGQRPPRLPGSKSPTSHHQTATAAGPAGPAPYSSSLASRTRVLRVIETTAPRPPPFLPRLLDHFPAANMTLVLRLVTITGHSEAKDTVTVSSMAPACPSGPPLPRVWAAPGCRDGPCPTCRPHIQDELAMPRRPRDHGDVDSTCPAVPGRFGRVVGEKRRPAQQDAARRLLEARLAVTFPSPP